MNRIRYAAFAAAMLTTLALDANAQGLPAYVPINPVTTSRSALYFQPYLDPSPKWRLTTQLDWSSIIEVTPPGPNESLLIDAEVVRLDVTLVKDYGAANFVMLSAGVAGAYDGILDGFFNWYHDFTGLDVPARDVRPNNEFAYTGVLPGGQVVSYDKSDLFLTDLKIGFGVRNTPSIQTMVFFTLPTTTHQDGFGRGVISANALVTARRQLSSRFTYEGSAGFGWAPRHDGDLKEFQKTTFYSASSGLRFRFWGRQAAFFNGFFQSSGYKNSNIEILDRSEVTADMGFLLRTGKNAPELILALTEDLKPSGPAVDAAFRIGLRW